jgi:hypothetical protein
MSIAQESTGCGAPQQTLNVSSSDTLADIARHACPKNNRHREGECFVDVGIIPKEKFEVGNNGLTNVLLSTTTPQVSFRLQERVESAFRNLVRDVNAEDMTYNERSVAVLLKLGTTVEPATKRLPCGCGYRIADNSRMKFFAPYSISSKISYENIGKQALCNVICPGLVAKKIRSRSASRLRRKKSTNVSRDAPVSPRMHRRHNHCTERPLMSSAAQQLEKIPKASGFAVNRPELVKPDYVAVRH